MTQAAFPFEEFVHDGERFSSIVDQFIMSVTQSLCTLEKENGQGMSMEENRALKALILQALDGLDGMVSGYRNGLEVIGACRPAQAAGDPFPSQPADAATKTARWAAKARL